MSPPVSLDDRAVRLVGIPAFGVAIPILADLYGDVGPRVPHFWLGAVVFLALSFAIWQGNRWLLLRRRSSMDLIERPLRRVAFLVVGIVFFTAPLTIGVLSWWSAIGAPLSFEQVGGVTLANVVCVVVVAHGYETVLLVKDRAHDIVNVERAERARVEAELLALRRQVDPHFLFNCLNTLQHLIDEDRGRARTFNQDLAAVLRYLLQTSDRHVVSLQEELEFLGRYAGLLRIRFGDAVAVEVRGTSSMERALLPPTSLQLLLENVVKHNVLSPRAPLVVALDIERDRVVVSNERRPKRESSGAGLGLKNLAERARLACGRGIEIVDDGARFAVAVPLVEEAR